MCGIYGELCLKPGARPGADGEQATERLAHRGPDDRGAWRGERVFLGVRRLAVMDPLLGRQPMWSADGTSCLVYNGELYNFGELRRELSSRGHTFMTSGDTEVVMRAYEQWGTECLRHFEGMFALALWDGRLQRLLLARDPIGEKPLYYLADTERLRFASEPKAILGSGGVRARMSLEGLGNYLAFGHSVAPTTMLEGIVKLLPGHMLIADDGGLRTTRYWDVDPAAAGAGATVGQDEHAERLGALLEDSVQRRLRADAAVGAFLSGGLDSGAVVALAARRTSRPIKTFSAGFDGGPDELAAAAATASALGTEHHELRVTAADAAAALPQLVHHHDEPFSDPASLPLLLLSGLASRHVKVVLTGDGGDELFGGYRRYAAEQLARPWGHVSPRIREDLMPALAARLPRARRLKRAVSTLALQDPAQRYGRWLRVMSPELEAVLLQPGTRSQLGGHDPSAIYQRHFEHSKGADHLNRLMYADLKTWLADGYMEKTDKATMAHGLEARLPILDTRLVALAFEIPAAQKIRGVSTKRVFKRAMEGVVPPSVLLRRKRGFTVPIESWLQGELHPYARATLLDRRALDRGIFEPKVVERLLTEQADGRGRHGEVLWPMLCLELWQRAYLDGGSA